MVNCENYSKGLRNQDEHNSNNNDNNNNIDNHDNDVKKIIIIKIIKLISTTQLLQQNESRRSNLHRNIKQYVQTTKDNANYG